MNSIIRRGIDWRLAVAVTAVLGAAAQSPVAPTEATTGAVRGANAGPFNIQQSFEVGERIVEVDGDRDVYRSQANFGNGVRLLNSSFAAFARDGQNRWLDRLTVTTQGLGNDPYESARLHAESRWYDYDLRWRSSTYFNPGAGIAQGLHAIDTVRGMQDQDLVLLPKGRLRLLAGYSRYVQDGVALTTNLNQGYLNTPLFQQIHRVENEYRAGAEIEAGGVRFTLQRSWRYGREETPASSNPSAAAAPQDYSLATSEVSRSSSPAWRFTAARDLGDRLSLNGLLTYAGSRGDSRLDEVLTGPPSAGQSNSQTVVTGNASRPLTTAHLNVVFTPTQRLTVTNQSSYTQVRMNGDNVYGELNNSTLAFQSINFQFLGIQTAGDQTDILFRWFPWLSLTGGYHIASRTIRSERHDSSADLQPADQAQSNTQQAWLAGVRLRFWKNLTLNLDGERGVNDRPVYPVSDKDYHALNGRLQYKSKRLLLLASERSNYNTNAATISAFSSHARTASLEGSWTARDWITIEASYSKIYLRTAGGIAYFVDGTLNDGFSSLYVSNLHVGSAWLRLAAGKRASLRLGYVQVVDAGDGRPASAAGAGPAPALAAAHDFPMSYASPQAQLSIPFGSRLRWNAGWQMYRYSEVVQAARNYRAQTGYTSVMWSF